LVQLGVIQVNLNGHGYTVGHIIGKIRRKKGDAENARPENDGRRKTMGLKNAREENDGQKLRGLENAGLENDGQHFSKL